MAEQTVELYTGSATGTQIDNAAAKVAAMEETLSGTAATIPSSAAVKNYVDSKAVEIESTLSGNAVYDISEANNGTTYANLAAALNNGNNIPASIRKGGISIKFIQSSDNKYVQFRYMSSDASTTDTFTNVANWQGVDEVPTAGSRNLITSGGVMNAIGKWGVVSQTLNVIIVRDPVVQTTNKGYNIEATDPVEGWIPQANIDLFENAGAVFNSSTGYFELNGITNIAYDEMQRIYTTGDIWRYYTGGDMNIASSQYDIGIYRTVFPTSSIKAIASSFIRFVFNLEVIKISRTPFIYANNGAISFAFYNDVNALKKVLDRIDCQANTAFNLDNCFTGCPLLETIYINRLQNNIGFKLNYKLSYETVSYMVSHATNTSAITITVHPTIYGYLTGTIQPPEETGGTSAEWQQIVTDATAKNISFASA